MPSHIVDVVGVGANSVDLVYRVPVYPTPHGGISKVPIAAHRVSCGGQTATALCTCAGLGLHTRYVGTLGSDAHADLIRGVLQRHGVDTRHAIVRHGDHPFAVILIAEDSGERVVLWRREASLSLSPADLDVDVIRGSRLLHVDDVDLPAALAACQVARHAGLPITSDIESPAAAALVEAVTIPILAEAVPAALTGRTDPIDALRALRRPHHQMLVATLGARGAVAIAGDAVYQTPGIPVETVDTTGAGDIFRGAFIVGWLEGRSPLDVLQFANAAAAVSCTRAGAIDSIPSLDEIRRVTGV